MFRRPFLILLPALIAAILAGGCADPNGGMAGDRQRGSPHDTDIYKVIGTFPQNMWRSFDAAGDRNPEGFEFVMLLLSRETGLGVHAPGTFHLTIYRIDSSGDKTERDVAIELAADMADLPRRSRSSAGESYQPSIWWGDLDIYGEEIEIVVSYESPTGRIVQSQTTTRHVPKRRE